MKGDFCYLLGKNIGSSRTATNVNAGVQTKMSTSAEPTAGASICTTSINCPKDDQCRYTIKDKHFIARCNYDYYGGDIGTMAADSLTECVNECAAFPSCVAATFLD
ncbi:cytochrome p450 4a10 [Stemphylium lycopersici]|nr:cytochrome p450 4a10 [Stemphylium lycopersici]